MTTPIPDDNVVPPPDPDQPNVSDLLGQVVRAKALETLSDKLEEVLRDQAETAFLAAYDTHKMTKADITVPGVGRVADATLKDPGKVADVTDEAAYLAHVEKRHPSEIERTLTISLAHEGFGVDALVAAIRELVDEYPGLATVKETRTIRAAYRKVNLASLAKNATGTELLAEELDMTSGALVPVPGVTVRKPPRTGAFVINGFTEDAKRRVLAALDRDGLASLLGVQSDPPAIHDSRTIAGEAKEVTPGDGTQG